MNTIGIVLVSFCNAAVAGRDIAKINSGWVAGLILFSYLVSHFLNHSLGNISLEAMEYGLGFHMALWRSWPGTLLLYPALAVQANLSDTDASQHPVHANYGRIRLQFFLQRRAQHSWLTDDRPSSATAKALDLTVPQSLLARADEVIE